MSLHAQLSPEALATLRKQQRNSTISSIIIAVLLICLICIILLWVLLPAIENNTPQIVSYQATSEEPEQVHKRVISRSIQKKPSSPPSAMAKVIASNTVSNLAIPVPTEITTINSMDFGDGDDDGIGWGDGDWGGGSAGSTTFFGSKIKGERILYVIDYSASMKGEREKLMRDELSKSVVQLPAGKKYQLIFFSGPAWIAGDEMSMRSEEAKKMGGKLGATVIAKGGHKYEWIGHGGPFPWDPIKKNQQAYWLEATDKNIKKSEETILNNKLYFGTNWINPLEMAFNIEPLPNVIIFMTDGLSQGDPTGVAEKYSNLAKEKGIIINTIALMEPRAATAMEILASGTGGTFSLINANGEKVPPNKTKPKKGRKRNKGNTRKKDK